jgi:hypothetical protein
MKPWENIFDFEHCLTPFAIDKIYVDYGKRKMLFVYIFGFRIFTKNISQ